MGSSHEVAAILPHAILRYVARAVGTSEVDEIRAAVGEIRTVEELAENGEWCSIASTMAIAEAATLVTGDPSIGRRGGEELFRSLRELGFLDMLLAKSSLLRAMERIVEVSSRVTVTRRMTVIERTEHAVMVEGLYDRPPTSPVLCEFAAGFWSMVPSLFGATGYAAELECQARGDRRCLTRVTWTSADPCATDTAAAAEQREQVFVRFEELQAMASELVAAGDVTTVLDLIVTRAGTAVLAPQFLLVVRLDDEQGFRIHHRGFPDESTAQSAADELIACGSLPSALVVEVASARRTYGKIAALYPPGSSDTGTYNRRLMTAYAGHAAATLEATCAWERAAHDQDTSRALLDLGKALARLASPDEVSGTLARALLPLTGASVASVWLWEPGKERFRLASVVPPAEPGRSTLSVTEVEGMDTLVERRRPALLDVADQHGALRDVMVAFGAKFAAMVPLVAHGTFLGVVAASFPERVPDAARPDLLDRLGGFADQAATALENARLVERIRHQALHDPLTGLANRPLVEELTTRALRSAERTGQKVALLFIDLDRFKNVNDTLGHHAGDDLLRQVAARLVAVTRSADVLARLGGDEFVVLVPDVDDDAVPTTAAGRLLDALRAPFDVRGRELFISGSVGIALAPAHGTDFDALLQHADTAMYAAKDQGRDTFVLHDRGHSSARHELLELESALHTALEKNQFTVLYQPQIDLRTLDVVGVEALLRWNHPTRGQLGPDHFLTIAEERGLIVAIDRWVRRTTFAQAQEWDQAAHAPLRLALNVSEREIRNPATGLDLAADLAEFGLRPERVEIEVTDRVDMADDELPVVLAALRATGVRLAIDDFGTGTSVLRRLQQCAIDTLKIDKSFIWEIGSISGRAIVAALVQMADSLDLQVVAEGIETAEQAAALTGLGCHLGQGYHFSRPITASAVTDLITGSDQRLVSSAIPTATGTRCTNGVIRRHI